MSKARGRNRHHPAVGTVEALSERLRPLFRRTDVYEPLPEPESGEWLAEHPESGQPFEQFVASRPNRPTDQRDTIYALPLGTFEEVANPSLEILSRFTEHYFQMPVEVLSPLELADYDITERQNNRTDERQLLTTDLLEMLSDQIPSDGFCLIGITMVDLYPDPAWNFVFGQASLRNRVGVYSFARYGVERPARVLWRTMKVMSHEISHMFGLHHCVYFRCAMNGSNNLSEADRRPMHLCPVDLRKLHWSIDFEPVTRYRQLRDLYEELGFDRQRDWVKRRLEAIPSEH